MIGKIGGRKFVLAIMALVLIVANKQLGLDLGEETINQLIVVVLGYAGVNVLQKATKK